VPKKAPITSTISPDAAAAMLALRRRRIVRALRDACAKRGRSAWIVGGALRDAAMGRPPGEIREIDAAVDGDPEPIARDLENAGLGRAVFLSKDRPGPRVYRVAAAGTELDLAALHGDGGGPPASVTIAEDLARRDFTVNALALPVAGGPLVDPFGGAADLRRRALRGVRERNFHEDPLRGLRAARLIATRRLIPDARLLAWSRAAAPALSGVAAERVSAELAKMLAAPRVQPALAWARRAGLLSGALGAAVSGPAAARLAGSAGKLDAAGVRRLAPERRRRLRLAWIAGRLRLGDGGARRWLAGRRWGRREAEEVAALVGLARRAAASPTGDDAWRWVLDAGPLAADAARLAAIETPRATGAARRLAALARRPRRSLDVTGRDVMEWTDLPPGPRVGSLLQALAVAASAGRVASRRQAKQWLLAAVGAT